MIEASIAVMEEDRWAEFLKRQARHHGPAWAVWRAEDKIGTLRITKITHRQLDHYYGVDLDSARHRTVRQKWIIRFFQTKAEAKAALAAGKVAWAAHEAAMQRAREVFRRAEREREDAMWAAIRGLSGKG